jgi:DNA-binding PadR family transcriptional regulator
MDLMREFLRGAVPVHVLHHATEGDVYGAWMSAELTRHGYRISPGTLYPLLHRMEAAGLLTSRGETSAGRVRRLYSATPAGRQALAAVRLVITELADEVLPRAAGRARP